MPDQTGEQLEKTFSRLAGNVARACGRPWAFALCLLSIIVWLGSGPLMHYSETWQLIINTIITFLMVFLIQNTQNRDGVAVQAKLDELIRSGNAKNDFVGLEHLTAAEIEEVLSKRCPPSKRRKSTAKPRNRVREPG